MNVFNKQAHKSVRLIFSFLLIQFVVSSCANTESNTSTPVGSIPTNSKGIPKYSNAKYRRILGNTGVLKHFYLGNINTYKDKVIIRLTPHDNSTGGNQLKNEARLLNGFNSQLSSRISEKTRIPVDKIALYITMEKGCVIELTHKKGSPQINPECPQSAKNPHPIDILKINIKRLIKCWISPSLECKVKEDLKPRSHITKSLIEEFCKKEPDLNAKNCKVLPSPSVDNSYTMTLETQGFATIASCEKLEIKIKVNPDILNSYTEFNIEDVKYYDKKRYKECTKSRYANNLNNNFSKQNETLEALFQSFVNSKERK